MSKSSDKRTHCSATRRCLTENLEARRMLSSVPSADGPIVTGETFIGSLNAVTALQLQFNQPLDPATATNIKAYHIGRNFGSSDSGGFDPLGFLSVHSSPAGSSSAGPGPAIEHAATSVSVLHPDAAVGTVSYDDATQTVTIFAQQPFKAPQFFRFIRVAGTGPNAIKGANGLALDGDRNGHPGANLVIRYRLLRNKSISYTDNQQSHVQLRLSGPGQIAAFLPTKMPEPIIFLDQTDPNSSILTGKLTPSRHSSGTTTLQELSGVNSTQVQLGPEFLVNSTQP